MDIKLEKNEDLSGKIIVSLTKEDYAKDVDKTLKELGANRVIPGFRKGHISIEQLRKRFGKEAKSDVINRTVYEAVTKYIQENKLHILGSPLPEEVKEINLDDDDYTFTYRVGFAPELNLKLDKDVTLPYYRIIVSDEMKAEQNKMLEERFGSQVPGEEVDAKALVKGALMELDAEGKVRTDAEAIQNINAIVAPFLMKDKEQAQLFMGKKIGDKVVFNPAKASDNSIPEVASMLNIDKEKAAEVKADFELAIAEIIVVKPAEHNQEFYDNVFGKDKVHNEEEYSTALGEMISRDLKINSQQMFEGSAGDYIFEQAKGMKLPEAFLKDWLKANEKEPDTNIDELYGNLENSFKWQILKGYVTTTLNVSVTEADMLNRAKAMAFQRFAQYGIYNMTPEVIEDTAKRILSDRNLATRLHEEMEDVKMYQAIFDAVTVDIKDVTIDEFRELVSSHNKALDDEAKA